jgi:hypothetical protein
MNRYIKDNRVAVLTNPDAGWYTIHYDIDKLFDPDLVQQVLGGTGPDGLMVEWVVPGDQFRIETFNGKEVVTVLIIGSNPITGQYISAQHEHWLTA